MKKIVTSLFALTIACPAMAVVDIVADAETANCNNTVLHTYDSPTSLEADWTANTITLNWYNGNTKITPANNTANSCTYDGAITLPSSNPTKTGYTFAGWQLRTSSQGGQQNEPSTPQQTTFNYSDFSTFDMTINGTDSGYIQLDGSSRSKDTKFGLTQNGEWAAEFSYGIVKGIAKDDPYENEGDELTGDCLCQVTGFDADKDGTYASVSAPVRFLGYGIAISECAESCGRMVAGFIGTRYEVFDTLPSGCVSVSYCEDQGSGWDGCDCYSYDEP